MQKHWKHLKLERPRGNVERRGRVRGAVAPREPHGTAVAEAPAGEQGE